MSEIRVPQPDNYLPGTGFEAFWRSANGTSKALSPLIDYWESKFNSEHAKGRNLRDFKIAEQAALRHRRLFEDLNHAVTDQNYPLLPESMASLASVASELVTLDVLRQVVNNNRETLRACFGLQAQDPRLTTIWEDTGDNTSDIQIDLRVIDEAAACFVINKRAGEIISLGLDVTFNPVTLRKPLNHRVELGLSDPAFSLRYDPARYIGNARQVLIHPNGRIPETEIYQPELVQCVTTQLNSMFEYLREHSPLNPWRAVALATLPTQTN